MSFMLTTDQIRNRTKTVTRRLGWWYLHSGTTIMACVKCQGLKKGEKVEKITPIRILNTAWTRLQTITPEDVIREGFPEMTPAEFVTMFCREMRCTPETVVCRIEFEYVEATNAA